MDSKLYLLVCEGPTDILILNKISEKISKDTNTHIQIRELSPQKDATTNRYPNHGWEEVKRWCELYGKSTGITNPFAALSAKQKSWKAQIALAKANGLIIQMDTDIVSFIKDLNPPYSGSTKKARKNFAKKAILQWLEEEILPENIYLLLSTSCSETWILATYDRLHDVFSDLNEHFDYEDIQNVLEYLFNLEYASYVDQVTGKKKLVKDLNVYNTYAKRIADNLEKVCLECEEAEKLQLYLKS